MRRGKAHNTVKILVDNIENGILFLNDETFQQLNKKHPPRHSPDPEVILKTGRIASNPIHLNRRKR